MVFRRCCVFGCNSSESDVSLSFYSIPKCGKNFSNPETIELYERRRQAWLKVLRLEEVNVTKKTFVCSLHFLNGTPSTEVSNVNWIPNIALGYSENVQQPSDEIVGNVQHIIEGASTSVTDVTNLLAGSSNTAIDGSFPSDWNNTMEESILASSSHMANGNISVEDLDEELMLHSKNSTLIQFDDSKQEIEFLKQEIVHLQQKLSTSEETSAKLSVEIKKLKEKFGQLGTTPETLNRLLETPIIDFNSLKQESNLAQQESENLRRKLSTSEEKCVKLIQEVETLSEKIQQLGSDLEKHDICKLIIDNDELCSFYTGIHTYEKLLILFNFIHENMPVISQEEALTNYEQFVLVLVKFRLNLRQLDIAHRFGVSQTTVSKYLHKWVDILYTHFVPVFLIWPERADIRNTLPKCFEGHFEKCVVIIDCFEVFMDRPIMLKQRASTYSNYKSHNTVKYLIGITPQGVVSFISVGYGGRNSDVFIVEDSKFLDYLKPGDLVLADRGFLIHEAAAFRADASVKTPAFMGKNSQLSPWEVEESRDISKCRIHVERVIGVLRERFSILCGPLNHEMLYSDEDHFALIDKIVAICCALNNCNPSIVPQE